HQAAVAQWRIAHLRHAARSPLLLGPDELDDLLAARVAPVADVVELPGAVLGGPAQVLAVVPERVSFGAAPALDAVEGEALGLLVERDVEPASGAHRLRHAEHAQPDVV